MEEELLQCVIVDDEPLALDLLEEYVRQTPWLHLQARCTSGQQALELIGQGGTDVAFLDIQMPGLNGIELSRRIEGRTKVIFTTAFEQYAIEGFRVDALDYLLKPFSYAEFSRAADKARAWMRLTRGQETQQQQPARSARSIIVKSGYKQHVIPVSEIVYIESLRDYVNIVTVDGRIKTLMSMKSMEEMLPAGKFARTHRSYLVNIDRIRTVERSQAIVEGHTVPVSESCKEALLAKLSGKQ